MLRPLVLLIHPDAVAREILAEQLAGEFRLLQSASAAEVPHRFDEPPLLVLGDADLVPELDALCARLRKELRAVRAIALTRIHRARQLPAVDVVLTKPVPIDRLRQTLLREARLCQRISGPRPLATARRPPPESAEDDPDDVVTRRIKY